VYFVQFGCLTSYRESCRCLCAFSCAASWRKYGGISCRRARRKMITIGLNHSSSRNAHDATAPDRRHQHQALHAGPPASFFLDVGPGSVVTLALPPRHYDLFEICSDEQICHSRMVYSARLDLISDMQRRGITLRTGRVETDEGED
jgi:hypothetical protein